MSFLLDIFKPAPFIEEIKDQEVVDKSYRYWRIRIFYSTFIGYALYYFTRKSFTSAMPGLITDLGYSKAQLGLLITIISISYAISKFCSGILSDRSNPRYFMAFGLIMTGVFNILFGLSSSFYLLAFFWGMNGLFQGFGWPPCAHFLTHWYSHKERGSWWSSWNVSHNVGSIATPLIVVACLQYFGWRYAMFIPGIICIFGGLFLLNRLRDTPQSLGLPPIEKFRNDYDGASIKEVENEHELTTKEILIDHILKNKFIWLLAFAYFFIYFARTAVGEWGGLYLIESKGYSSAWNGYASSIFEFGGLFGSLAAGWSSDKLFGAKRGPVNILFTLGILCSMILFCFLPRGYPSLDMLSLFLLGFSIFGPQLLIGVAAAELSHKKAAATSTGFVGCFAYVGSAFAGALGKIVEVLGWESYFIVMIICTVCALLLLAPLWNVTKQKAVPQLQTV